MLPVFSGNPEIQFRTEDEKLPIWVQNPYHQSQKLIYSTQPKREMQYAAALGIWGSIQ